MAAALLGGAVACSALSTALAQAGDAAYGTVSLAGGFLPDPHAAVVLAGGPDAASRFDRACAGYIDGERPDYTLQFTRSSRFALKFFVMANIDTTLVVSDPTGHWHCNDDYDTLGGTSPGVSFTSPESGTYRVWVGTHDSAYAGEQVKLLITESTAPWEPAYGTATLEANFRPDPYMVEVEAGGIDPADALSSGCAGYVRASKADYGLRYTNAGRFGLGVFAEGAADSTLVVQDPQGRFHCNDDYSSAGGLNPGVVISEPVDGFYRVWVGTYDAGDLGERISLLFTERGSPWDGPSGRRPRQGPASSSGTGFLVSREGHLLTNHHVVDGCARTTFQIPGQDAVEAELLAVNAETDLALLRTPLTHDPLPFRPGRAIRLGEEVVVFGFPLLGDLSSQGNLTYGIVSGLSGLNDDPTRLQMSAQIQPGNSGGPMLDRQGHVVGVVVEMANDEYFRTVRGSTPQNVNFAVRDAHARAFLETHRVPFALGDGDSPQLSIADIAESAQQATGTILCY